MSADLEVVFKNMPRSEFVAARVHDEIAKLGRVFNRVMSVRVVVEAENRSRRHGDLFRVGIHATVPPRISLDVTRAGPRNHAHEDVYVAIRDAFQAMRRRLQEHAQHMEGRVKTHEAPLHGRVIRLVGGENAHGFVAASDGSEVYFHRNSVSSNGFDHLEEGSEVRIVVAEKEGEKGPQASSIVPIGKHHIVD